MYVIKTVNREEKKAKQILENKGYKVLCPRKIKLHKKGDSYYEKEMVLFTGYIFLDCDKVTDRQYYDIKSSYGVTGFLSLKYALSKCESEYMRLLDNENKPMSYINISFDENGKAKIKDSFMKGLDEKIVSVNRKDKTVAMEFTIEGQVRKIILNYK